MRCSIRQIPMVDLSSDSMNHCTFLVFHKLLMGSPRTVLGSVEMTDGRVKFKADESAHAWFEAQQHGYLADFKKVVRRLCRSVGYTSRFSISWDEDSGVEVERK